MSSTHRVIGAFDSAFPRSVTLGIVCNSPSCWGARKLPASPQALPYESSALGVPRSHHLASGHSSPPLAFLPICVLLSPPFLPKARASLGQRLLTSIVTPSCSVPPGPFFLKIPLAIQDLLCFHMNCEIFYSSSVKKSIGILIGITLNL